MRPLDFLMFSVITLNIVFSCGEDSFFLVFVLRYFVSGVCLSIYVFVFCHLKLGVLGPWEFLWRAGSYIFCVCVFPLCGVPGRYNFIRALSWSGWRDCTDFSFSLALM
jgi:hypothetical protein